jgi:DNA-binding MarR family transcriptional regulator
MPRSVQEEIKQTRPFVSVDAEAYVSLKRTASLFERQLFDLMKPHGLTPTQYNVLRILRGAGPEGLCRFEISDRLIAPDPDVTRLLDRLERSRLVTRERDDRNRRLVKARITRQGLNLLDEMDDSLNDLHVRQFGRLSADETQKLIGLLAKARASIEPD